VKLSIAAAGCLAGLVIASALASTVESTPEQAVQTSRSLVAPSPAAGRERAQIDATAKAQQDSARAIGK
jgi:hypothetical protein